MANFNSSVYTGTRKTTFNEALTDLKDKLVTIDTGSSIRHAQIIAIGDGKYFQGGMIYG